MSLKSMLEKIEHFLPGKSHSRKQRKKFRNKWLRLFKKTEIPPTKYRTGHEY